jgi:tetratricopeptide (TPR) repeat protein
MRAVLLLLFFSLQTDYQEEGLKALEAKQYPAAIAAFEKAVAADAKDYGAHFHLGLAHSMAGNAPAAIDSYKAALALSPGLYEAELNLGVVLIDARQPEEAAAALQSALTKKPDQFRPNYYLAEALMAGQRFGEAEPYFRKATELDPASIPARAGLGRTLARQGKLKEADVVLKQAADMDGLLELAAYHEKAKDYAAAIAIYRSAPHSPAIVERLGNLLIESGKPEEAIPALEAAVKQSPTAANRYALGTAYLRAKRTDQAMAMMEQALGAEPDNTELRIAYAGLLRDQKDLAAAAKQFWQVTQKKPDSREAWSGLATMLLSLENYPQAVAAFGRIIALGDPNPGIYFLRALAYDKTKNYEPAMADYERFLTLSQNRLPDEEFKARQRIKVIKKELSRR